MADLSVEEYIAALEKMKRGPSDRIGTLGGVGITGLSAASGAALSGTVASWAGASTLAGSSTLGSLLGGIFVTSTPIGWVVGGAVAGGVLGYGAFQLMLSGARSDVLKTLTMKELEVRIDQIRAAACATDDTQAQFNKLISSLQLLVTNERVSQSKSDELIRGVQAEKISIDKAFAVVEGLLREEGL